jgi:putative tryptophan/tyrosine transport system substrate-binding protein
MRRREFITLIGGAAAPALLWPLAARAQQPARVWRIGWLSPGSGPGPSTQEFLRAMQDRGYVEDQNLVIEYRWAANSDEQMADLAADLVRKGLDLIVTAGTPATLAAKQATSTIPIVFAVAGAPVEKGLVDSLAHPGGNVTGLALIMDALKALEILKEAAPRVSRVAFIYDPSTVPGGFEEGWLNRIRARSRTLKVHLQPVVLQKPNEIDRVLAPLADGVNALLVDNSATNALARRRICTLAAERRMPAVSTERSFADAGCLMSYGEDQLDMYRRAAGHVDRILKGAKPADLPVEQPTRFRLVLNLKTAKAIGLDVPPMLLARADEVIE